MSMLLNPDIEFRLHHIDRLLARGKGRPEAAAEARRVIKSLHAELFTRARAGRLPPTMHDAFHRLMARADSAKTPEEIRDLVNDLRQYLIASSSAARAHGLEGRLHELEAQMQVAAQQAVAETPTAPEDSVVTVESLKEKRVLFAIMPFHQDFEDVWSGGIQRAAAGTGLTPIRIDMITNSGEITDEIVDVIELAEIVVVDVTRNNPNVMFEFGFALALKKRHAIISQSTEFLPFDIKNLRTIIYQNSWRGIETLHKELQRFIKGAIGQPAKTKTTRKKTAATKKRGA